MQGTVDCILCRDSGEVDACKALQNVYNELKHPGAFVMFSHSPPVIRLGLLQSCAWDDVQVMQCCQTRVGGICTSANVACSCMHMLLPKLHTIAMSSDPMQPDAQEFVGIA